MGKGNNSHRKEVKKKKLTIKEKQDKKQAKAAKKSTDRL